jgi:cysteine-rich secretory family protein
MRWDFVRTAMLGSLACFPISLALVAVPLATPANADVVAPADMLQLNNQMRFAIGSPTVPADPRLTQAAINHANYSSANGQGGHYETAGLPYYTGYAPRDRLIAAGWTTSFVSEVATGGSGLAGVRQLWDAPYHRLGMMHPNATNIGWGHSSLNGRETTVGDLVYNFGFRAVDFVRSPAHLQTNIPISWSGRESPNPLPSGVSGPVGYPIMVVYSAGQNVQMRAAEVVAPGGARLPIYYAPQQFEYDYQVIIPQRPLVANTTYHVRFDITVAGTFVTNEWDFSTGSTVSTAPPPPPADNGLHSSWTSQTTLPAMQPAAQSQVTLAFRNTGTKTWTKGVVGSQVALGVRGDSTAYSSSMNVGWPMPNRVAVQNEAAVGPGAVASFTFTVKAPLSAGTVQIPLRPVVDGVAWLEDQGVFVPVTTRVDYHSRWVSESAFPTLRVGQTSGPLSIVFRNAGSQPWVKGTLGQEARLGVNLDNEMWAGLSVNWPYTTRPAVQTETTVLPGATGTFTFQVRAPATPGTYAIHLRPVIDGVWWMEDEGVFLYITVTP